MIELESAKYLQADSFASDDDDQLIGEPNQPAPETSQIQQHSAVHPTVYLHEACQTATQMPSNIRANYLADPFFYSSGTICSQCGPVKDRDCTWLETGENLHSYMQRLKAAKSETYHLVRWLLPALLSGLLAIGTVYRMVAEHKPVEPAQVGLLFVVGYAVAWYPAKFVRLALCRLGIV